MNKEEELPNEGLFVQFLVSMEDVTPQVLSSVEGNMSEMERGNTINAAIDSLQKAAKGDTHYDIKIKPFFGGNEYYLFVYETYRDVRLVGAPPESIGKFGGDTDNWMWPRHTGDFSLFRVYMSPEGKPAEYSPENIPLKPRYHLPVSLSGVQKGDFAMIFGYPGSTNRYLTSYGIKEALEISNPTRVAIRDKRLEIMKTHMDANKTIRLQYASKYAGVSNYWKYFIGQSQGLKRLKVYDQKKALEDQFTNWVNQSEGRKAKYGNALKEIEQAYEQIEKFNQAYIYYYEAGYAPEIVKIGVKFKQLAETLSEDGPDSSKVAGLVERIGEYSDDFFKDYNKKTDRDIFIGLYDMFYENVDPQYFSSTFNALSLEDTSNFFSGFEVNETGDVKALADFVYGNTFLVDQENVESFLKNPDVEKLTSDPGYKLAIDVYDGFYNMYNKRKEAQEMRNRGRRLFIEGLRKMNPDKKYYPDANSSMRITYGTVGGYEAKDAVYYDYTTTLEGVMEKEDPDNFEFIVDPKLKALYEAKDYGRYGQEGKLIVNFLSNNDITGGNSGSPVINGKGHLIGTAFDGNWEAMSGDIAFEPDLQRTISVDIRYTLFIIDKFAGAGHLVDEMTLVTDDSSNKEPVKKKRKRKKRNNSK
jgi:hypothetical protein